MKIGVVGYSTRALVEALVELGCQVVAVDAFGDQDTLELAESCHVVSNWPADIVTTARQCAVDAWLLAGGMENHPAIVEHLNQLAPVLGPNADELVKLRDPKFWEALCQGIEHLGWPPVHFDASPSPSAYASSIERWIFKQTSGSGGLHISDTARPGATGYYQQFIDGRSLGVTFILGGQTIRIAGATQSLSASDWPGPTPFIYRGSFGPVDLTDAQCRALLSLAGRIAAALPGLRGWLQADFIEDTSGKMWLLELNPRWTAGMEILHSCVPTGRSPLLQHLHSYTKFPVPLREVEHPRLSLKAIVYAQRDWSLTQATRQQLWAMRGWQSLPGLPIEISLADLPATSDPAPVLFTRGSPILTVRLRR